MHPRTHTAKAEHTTMLYSLCALSCGIQVRDNQRVQQQILECAYHSTVGYT